MKDNKLTPEEIKKALECCAGESPNCSDCPANRYEAGKCFDIVKVQAVAVMNSQQEEIEEWKKINQQLYNEMEERRKEDIGIAKGYARIEAIKEFAERLQEKADDIGIDEDGFLFTISAEWKTWFRVGDWCEEIIDNLVKEMVGEDK